MVIEFQQIVYMISLSLDDRVPIIIRIIEIIILLDNAIISIHLKLNKLFTRNPRNESWMTNDPAASCVMSGILWVDIYTLANGARAPRHLKTTVRGGFMLL